VFNPVFVLFSVGKLPPNAKYLLRFARYVLLDKRSCYTDFKITYFVYRANGLKLFKLSEGLIGKKNTYKYNWKLSLHMFFA
jgi:hypothetical protein